MRSQFTLHGTDSEKFHQRQSGALTDYDPCERPFPESALPPMTDEQRRRLWADLHDLYEQQHGKRQ